MFSPQGNGGASFTMRLKRVIEVTGGTLEIVGGVSQMTGGDIGLQYYPIFDEAYRPSLTGRIIDHYLNREIGAETIDIFQLYMRRKMNEIMPFYNKLYLSERLEFDPFHTVDISTVVNATSTNTGTSTGTGETETDSTQGSRSVNFDTPQTMLANNADYASSGVDATGTSTAKGNSSESRSDTSEGANDSTSRTTGYQAMPADLLSRYRDTLINVDLMIIAELEPCFMQVLNTTDPYYRKHGYYV